MFGSGCGIFLLDGLDNDIAVGGRVPSANQSNRVRDAGLEVLVGFTSHFGFRERGKASIESFDCLRRVCLEEFLGLPNLPHLEIGLEEAENIENVGNTPGESKVYGLNFVPVRKCPVADYEGICMTNSGEEV